MTLSIFEEVKVLGLPLGEYVVIGSGSMSARGIRKHEDIDLLVTEHLYDELKKEGWEIKHLRPDFEYIAKGTAGASPKMISLSNYNPDLLVIINRADLIEGIPFMNLKDLVEFKKALGREKDIKDISLIEKYIEEHF